MSHSLVIARFSRVKGDLHTPTKCQEAFKHFHETVRLLQLRSVGRVRDRGEAADLNFAYLGTFSMIEVLWPFNPDSIYAIKMQLYDF